LADIWAIASDHGEWTVAVGDSITFLDNVAHSDRLVRRAGTMNAPPTLADSQPDAPLIDLPVWCVRGGGSNPITVTVHVADVVDVEIRTERPDA
jgi:hypothetical protein